MREQWQRGHWGDQPGGRGIAEPLECCLAAGTKPGVPGSKTNPTHPSLPPVSSSSPWLRTCCLMRSFAEAPQLFWDIITLKIFRTVEKSDVQSLIFLEYLKFSSQWFQDLWLNAFPPFFYILSKISFLCTVIYMMQINKSTEIPMVQHRDLTASCKTAKKATAFLQSSKSQEVTPRINMWTHPLNYKGFLNPCC